jgi:hypothetical protein
MELNWNEYMHWFVIAVCGLLTLLCLYGVISPQAVYELWHKMGHDNHRRLSPERGPLCFWMARTVVVVMFLTGLVCMTAMISEALH